MRQEAYVESGLIGSKEEDTKDEDVGIHATTGIWMIQAHLQGVADLQEELLLITMIYKHFYYSFKLSFSILKGICLDRNLKNSSF